MYDDYYLLLPEHEFRGELRLMALRQLLLDWGVELRSWRALPAPAPHFSYVTCAEFFTHNWNVFQAKVFIKAVCDDVAHGFPCEALVMGRHASLRSDFEQVAFRLWV